MPEIEPHPQKSDQNLVWLDCEMTGLDPEKERIIEIAVVVTGPSSRRASKARSSPSTRATPVLDLMDAWNKGTHGRSGLIDKVKASTVSEAAAEQQVLAFLAKYVPKRLADVRQHHRPGPALPGEVHAQAGGLLPLPQPRRQHPQGAGQALEARGLQRLQEAQRTRRWPTCTSPSTSSRTTASTSCAGPRPELLAAVADLGFTQPTTVQTRCIGSPWARPGRQGPLHRPDGLQPDRQRQDRGLPAARAAHAAQAPGRSRSRSRRIPAPYAEAIARGEAPPKKPKRKDPTKPAHFKAATPGALILCPTRELAQQVAHDAIDLVRHCRGLRIANVVGGMPYQCRSPSCRTPTSWSPRPAACWTCNARSRSSWTRCSSWWSTKPTACWTSASPTTWPKSTS
jgi:hypothetical protein